MTSPPGAVVKGPSGAILCAATPCELPNTLEVVSYSVELAGYKPQQVYSGPDFGDHLLTLQGAGEPDWVGCDAKLKCVPPWDGTTTLSPPFHHCAPKLEPRAGDDWSNSGFTPAGTLERRKTDPEVCCYSVGKKCPEKGRPLRDGDRVVVSEARERGDWQLAPPSGASAEPGVGWEVAAAAEHASIASFARFALELLALGAPAELVAGAHEAALEEIDHARITYGLASSARRKLGPGPLRSLPLGPLDAASVARVTFRDGCVSETRGALALRDAAAATTEPQLHALLEKMAEEEERHAALAWRTLVWLLQTRGGGSVQAALTAELSALDGADRTIAEVVLPCARALLDWGSRQASAEPARGGAQGPSVG